MISKDTLKDFPRPEWLPDWTKPEAYPDHGENAAAWAWEFLRRNPEYQADYAHFIAVPDSILAEDGFTVKSQKWQGSTYVPWADMQFYHAPAGAAHAGETVEAYATRTGAEPVRLETWLLQEWGLVHLNDPALDEPLWFSTNDPLPPFRLEQASYGHIFREYVDIDRSVALHYERPGREVIFASWPEQDDVFTHVFAFDVRLPLDGQLAAVKAELEEARLDGEPNDHIHWLDEAEPEPEPIKLFRPPSPRFGNMREYLRVFDAVWTEGWDRQAIADRIYGDKTSSEGAQTGSALKRVDRSIEQAMEYASGEYSALLLWGSFPKQLKKAAKE